jgi:hypothetical protein
MDAGMIDELRKNTNGGVYCIGDDKFKREIAVVGAIK